MLLQVLRRDQGDKSDWRSARKESNAADKCQEILSAAVLEEELLAPVASSSSFTCRPADAALALLALVLIIGRCGQAHALIFGSRVESSLI